MKRVKGTIEEDKNVKVDIELALTMNLRKTAGFWTITGQLKTVERKDGKREVYFVGGRQSFAGGTEVVDVQINFANSAHGLY